MFLDDDDVAGAGGVEASGNFAADFRWWNAAGKEIRAGVGVGDAWDLAEFCGECVLDFVALDSRLRGNDGVVEVEARRSEGGDQIVGGRTRVKVVKNKVAPPFREAEFDVMYGEGISREGDLLDLAVEKRIVEKRGAWFAYNGDRLGQGRENAKQFLKENPEIRQMIEDRVRRDLGMVREAEVTVV